MVGGISLIWAIPNNVILFDLRGHGESDGDRFSLGYFEKRDVLGAIRYLRDGKKQSGDKSSGPHHQDSGEAKIRESTAGVSRKPSSDCKACGCSSKHLCGLTAWNT